MTIADIKISKAPEAIAADAVEEDTLLEEKWDEELPCEAISHGDLKYHDPGAASVRATAPCGRTLNICAKFAGLVANRKFSLCLRGHVHRGGSYTFTDI